MPDTRQVIVAKKLEQLTLWEKDGMLVVSGRGMEGLKHLCVRCRFLCKKLEGQKTAPLPESLAVPAPPFKHVGLNLFGPLIFRKMGGGQVYRGGSRDVQGVGCDHPMPQHKSSEVLCCCGLFNNSFHDVI